MDKWQLFLCDAEDSINASELLFEHELYGKSAFHAQQCVELSIKAYLLKFYPDERDFYNHFPLQAILKNLKSDLIKLKSHAINPNIDCLLNAVDCALQDIIKRMDKTDNKEAYKKKVWAHAMGIGSEPEEFKSLKEIQNRKNIQFKTAVFDLVRDMFKQLPRNMRRMRKQKIQNLLPPPGRKIINEMIQLMHSNNREESLQRFLDLPDKITNLEHMLNLLFKPNGLLTNIIKLGKTVKIKTPAPLDLQRIFHTVYVIQHVEISLLTFPHETFGRYSDNIDGKATKCLYSENKDSLSKLIQQSRNVLESTDSTIKCIENNWPVEQHDIS